MDLAGLRQLVILYILVICLSIVLVYIYFYKENSVQKEKDKIKVLHSHLQESKKEVDKLEKEIICISNNEYDYSMIEGILIWSDSGKCNDLYE